MQNVDLSKWQINAFSCRIAWHWRAFAVVGFRSVFCEPLKVRMGGEAREMISFLADALESQSKASSNVAFKASCGSASDFLLLPPHDSNAISSRVNFNFLVFPTRPKVLVVEKVNSLDAITRGMSSSRSSRGRRRRREIKIDKTRCRLHMSLALIVRLQHAPKRARNTSANGSHWSINIDAVLGNIKYNIQTHFSASTFSH